jgi:hypothetical protein
MSGTSGVDFVSLFSQIEYLADKRFSEYHPTVGPPHKEFILRLRDWLDRAVKQEDQQTLLRMVPQLFFVGSREFRSLYRSALNGPITRWLIDQLGLQFTASTFHDELLRALNRTWFCGITDSMQIAEFHHVNNIEGADVRPDWQTLSVFASSRKIKGFMDASGYDRLVLLEDFVGTGSQMLAPVNFAANLPGKPEILVLPLIVAPSGLKVCKTLALSHSNVSFATTLELRPEAFVCEVPVLNEGELFKAIRALVVRLYTVVSGGVPASPVVKPYGPFGYNSTMPRNGALLVMYTNCPDNTLPIIHYSSHSWSPLFPRSARL